jgi:transposase
LPRWPAWPAPAAVSIYSWCAAYQQAGRGRKLAALVKEKPRSGRPRQIGPQAEQVLQSALGQSPLALQYQSPGWTLALLATHLQKCCGGERPSPDALRRRLHALGWRWKRPRYVFRQPDPQRVKKTRDPEALGPAARPSADFPVR